MVASAAAMGMEDPMGFVDRNLWQIVSDPAWSEAWDYATATANVNMNPDTGIRNDVINDDMIDAALTARAAELAQPADSGESEEAGEPDSAAHPHE